MKNIGEDKKFLRKLFRAESLFSKHRRTAETICG